MKTIIAIVAFLLMAGLAGCQTYEPRPLTRSSVDEALTPPLAEALTVRASEFKHPLLPTLKLSLNDGLSPDGAAVLAVLLNPGLRSQRDRRQVAQAQLTQAGLLPNPQLAYSLDVPTGGQTQGTTTAFGLGLTWDALQLISRSTNQEVAQAHLDSVALDVAWQEWQTAMAAKQSVYSLASLEARIVLATQLDTSSSHRLAEIRRAAKDHLATADDLTSAAVARDQAQSKLLELQKQASQERVKLLRLLGLPAFSNPKLQAGIKLPENLQAPTEAQLLKGLEQRRLDLVALRRGYESQEAAVHVAVMNQFPCINLGLTRAGDTSDVVTTGFTFSIDLPIFDRNQAKITRERATRQKLFDEYVDRVAQARSDLAGFLGVMHNLNQQVAAALTARTDLVSLEQSYRKAFKKNLIGQAVYNGILEHLNQKRLDVINLEEQLMETKIALELASGVYDLDAARSQSARLPDLGKGDGR